MSLITLVIEISRRFCVIEVEIKAKILNPDVIKRKFINMNGEYKISLIHEDTYFNMPKKLRDFRKTDEALRIRKSIEFVKSNDKSSIKKSTYYLTYKGKKIDKITKTRKEIETIIIDGDKVREILKQLGFIEVFTVKKERELYEFSFMDHQIEVLIDYIPILKKHFIEVEIMIDNNASPEELDKARGVLFDFLKMLNIKKEDSITKSYLELILDRFRGKVRR